MHKPVKWRNLTYEGFVQLADDFHGKKYDYSLVSFTDIGDMVTIKCPDHGEFQQRVVYHLTKAGCTFCSNLKRAETVRALCKQRRELKAKALESDLGLSKTSHLINVAWKASTRKTHNG
jgi:hypothetical protein